MTHKHHIIPKYRCKELGIDPDFDGNIVNLSVDEHIIAHLVRWVVFGRSEDLGAANILAKGTLGLSGKLHPMFGKKQSKETCEKRRQTMLGKKHPLNRRLNNRKAQQLYIYTSPEGVEYTSSRVAARNEGWDQKTILTLVADSNSAWKRKQL